MIRLYLQVCWWSWFVDVNQMKNIDLCVNKQEVCAQWSIVVCKDNNKAERQKAKYGTRGLDWV